LNPLEDAVRERSALAIQVRPAIVDHSQRLDSLAGADFVGERVDGHLMALGSGGQRHPRAFSSEVGTGSRKENASKQKARASVPISIGTEKALA
jgi:hypothetical protein